MYLDECPNCGAPRGKQVTLCPYCGTSLLNMLYVNEELGQSDLFDSEESRKSTLEGLQHVRDLIVSKAVPHQRRDVHAMIFAIVLLVLGTALAAFFALIGDDGMWIAVAVVLGVPLLFGWYICLGELRVCRRSVKAAEQDPMYKSTVVMVGESVKPPSFSRGKRQCRELYVVADIAGRSTCVELLVEDAPASRLARLYPVGSRLTIAGSGEYYVSKVL